MLGRVLRKERPDTLEHVLPYEQGIREEASSYAKDSGLKCRSYH